MNDETNLSEPTAETTHDPVEMVPEKHERQEREAFETLLKDIENAEEDGMFAVDMSILDDTTGRFLKLCAARRAGIKRRGVKKMRLVAVLPEPAAITEAVISGEVRRGHEELSKRFLDCLKPREEDDGLAADESILIDTTNKFVRLVNARRDPRLRKEAPARDLIPHGELGRWPE